MTTKQRLHSLIDALPDGDDRLKAAERMLDTSVSSNGASPNGVSSNGASPDVFIDDADRILIESKRARMDEAAAELEAEGVDGTEEYEKLLAKAATWSSA